MKRILLILAATAAGMTGVVAGPVETASVGATSLEPTVRYRSAVARDGTIDVRLANPAKRSDGRLLSVYRPDAEAVQQLIAGQDWYLKIGQDGLTRGIYTVPRGGALPANVIRRLSDNESLLRVKPGSSFLKVFPDANQMRSHLRDFTAATRDAACALKRRPERLSARVEVEPGWAANGRIEMTATWDTDTLCGPLATAEAKAVAD